MALRYCVLLFKGTHLAPCVNGIFCLYGLDLGLCRFLFFLILRY